MAQTRTKFFVHSAFGLIHSAPRYNFRRVNVKCGISTPLPGSDTVAALKNPSIFLRCPARPKRDSRSDPRFQSFLVKHNQGNDLETQKTRDVSLIELQLMIKQTSVIG